MKNGNGIEVSCLNYGGIITKIITPDRKGNYENIVLGFKEISKYQSNPIYAGAIVGPVAGRIQDGQFALEGHTYTLDRNDGQNHLHGGFQGFHKVIWNTEIIEKEQETAIEFSYTSVDGEGGYPGNLTTTVTYTLRNTNELIISYQGVSDKSTLWNPTNHTYFNLSGSLKEDILQHRLKMDSSQFLELTQELLPTGNLLNVDNRVFDFRNGRRIMEGIHSMDPQIIIAGRGYDHAFLLDSHNQEEIVLYDEKSGRTLTIETDAVCAVLYTGNCIPYDLDFYGIKSRPYLGLCLETQGFPDAIHHSNFPSCIAKKNEIFSTMTKYTFSID